MSMLEIEEIVYDDGRTKQSFKDSTDINKLLAKAQTQGSLSHLMKYPEAMYGEFDGQFDLLTAQHHLAKAKVIFDNLPSEVRREFGNKPLEFVNFANDPENRGRLRELLPELAEPGNYFPNPVSRNEPTESVVTIEAERAEPAAPVVPPAVPEGSAG